MMRTRSFNFFCMPDELLVILSHCFEALDGVSMFIGGADGRLPLRRIDLEEVTVDQPRVLWMEAGKDQPESFLGLIRLSLPQFRNKALCMASIAIKADGKVERVNTNLKAYEILKSALRQKLSPGLWGVNRHTGGEHFYKDLYISAAAISQFRSGLELAPEGCDGFVRFEYRDYDTGRTGATAKPR